MTKSQKYIYAAAAAAAGLTELLLRYLLYRMGVDDQGRLVFGHPLAAAVWLLPLLLLPVLVLAAGKLPKESPAVPLGKLPAVGSILLTAGLAAGVLKMESVGAMLKAARILGCLSAVSMCAAAVFRMKGKRPSFLLMVIPCIFFGVFLLSTYQRVRGLPQIMDCLPMMGAGISLLLYVYHQAALDLKSSSFRSQMIYGCLSIFFCITALLDGENPVLYGGCALWAACGIISLQEERKE